MNTSTLVRRLSKTSPYNALWLLIPLSLSPFHYAHAYIDPTSGSYAIQMAIGVIFGATYAFRSFVNRMVLKIRTRFQKNKPEA